MKESLFLLAGEKSGDLLGKGLVEALGGHRCWGVGGPKMRAAGMEIRYPMEELQMMGFFDVVRRLPDLVRQFRAIRNMILENDPAACILIDYPGFNLRLAKSLRKHGYKGKIIQYVSPTVWVWGKGRVKTLAKYYDLLLTILPFEGKYYAHTPLPVVYVGHPIAEQVARFQSAHPDAREEPLLALYPGSRKKEIELNLELELSLAKKLLKIHPDLGIAISCSQPSFHPLIEEKLKSSGVAARITSEEYPLMQACRAAIAKSGTVTLELGLFEKPAVVVYRLDWFNRLIAQYILRLKIRFVCMVNILAGKEVFPEFVTRPYTEEEIVAALSALVSDSDERTACLKNLAALKKQLGSGSPSARAAHEILNLISN